MQSNISHSLAKEMDLVSGFEVEGFIKCDNFLPMEKACYKQGLTQKGLIFSNDSTISYPSGRYQPFELKTPPASYHFSLEFLQKLFNILNEFGARTNSSCGLHFSFSSDFSKIQTFQATRFINNRIWRELVEHFSRENNEWCRVPDSRATWDDLVDYMQHDSCVNLEHIDDVRLLDPDLESDDNKYSSKHQFNVRPRKWRERIEIRGFGNTGVLERFDDIKDYCDKIIQHYFKCVKLDPSKI